MTGESHRGSALEFLVLTLRDLFFNAHDILNSRVRERNVYNRVSKWSILAEYLIIKHDEFGKYLYFGKS